MGMMNPVFKAKMQVNFDKSPKMQSMYYICIYQYSYRAARAFVALAAAIFECLIYISNLYITYTYII